MRSALAIALLPLLVACAASTEPNATGEEALTPAAPLQTASVREVAYQSSVGQCEVRANRIVVSTAPDEWPGVLVTRTMAETPDYALYQDPAACDEPALVRNVTRPVFNASQLLTVRMDYTLVSPPSERETPWFDFRTFDLVNGQKLELPDALDRRGLAAVRAGCERTFRENGLDLFVGDCHAVVEVNEFYSPAYTLETGGIRVHPTFLQENGWDVAIRGYLVPWSALRGHIKSPTIAALADSAS